MKMNIIIIFVCILLIATTMPAIGTMNKKVLTGFDICGNPTSYSIVHNPYMGNSHGGIFIQLPRDPDDLDKECYTSDSGTYVFKVYEDFWNVTSPICDIHWWGFSLKWIGLGWVSCDPKGMKFDIIFYENDGGEPGAEVCSYINITYWVNGTGIMYEWFGGRLHEMLYYEAQLDPCCELSAGWVSIQSTYSPNDCVFSWMSSADGNGTAYQYQPPLTLINDDLAFVLTEGETDNSNLECYGSLSWTDVKPGSKVYGNFTVENIGDPGTLLDWKVTEWPVWGTWTFTPSSGYDLKPEDGTITVQVSVVAPDEQNTNFTGHIKIMNEEDSSDFEIISVSLATPKKQLSNNTLFLRFLARFPIFNLLLRL